MRCFLTFACYGAHLHGDESGSVDGHHNVFGARVLEADPQRAEAERRNMKQSSKAMNEAGDDGHVMEARDGCGRIGMFVKRSVMWSRSKASPWRYSWGTCPEACQPLAPQPLAHARGSVPAGRARSSVWLHFYVAHRTLCRCGGGG
jgi:hypothetical protein